MYIKLGFPLFCSASLVGEPFLEALGEFAGVEVLTAYVVEDEGGHGPFEPVDGEYGVGADSGFRADCEDVGSLSGFGHHVLDFPEVDEGAFGLGARLVVVGFRLLEEFD